MSAKARDVNLVDGELVKPMLVLSLPLVFSQIMQVAYNLADTFWVGRVGSEAVSALSFSWPLVFLMISFGGGFTVAGTVLVAQNKGAGNHGEVDHAAGQTLGFVILLSAGFAVIGYLLTPILLPLIGTTPGTEVHQLAVEYTRTIFLGVAFMFGFFIFQALLRGWGDTRTPMYLMGLGVVINVFLDPFLILGFNANPIFGLVGLEGLGQSLFAATGFTGFGVQGAAIATVFSRGVGALVGFWLLLSGRVGISLSPRDLIPERETVERIVRIGAPSSIEQSTRALGVTALTALVAYAAVNAGGASTETAVAAFGIGNRLNSLVFLPAIGLAQGTSTVVGQNLGADQPDRAERAVFWGIGIIVAALVFVSAAAYLFAEPIVSVFIPGEEAVIAIGVDYLRIIGPTFLFLGAFNVVNGGFRGSGSTRTAMVFSLISLWVLRIPAAFVLVEFFSMGPTGIWYGIAFSNVGVALLAFAWFTRGTWKNSVVDVGPRVPTDD
ncbi:MULTISPECIES: MATE family efflux transporter [Haloferax]|uniref:Multidrug export protein MepA n=1 Tax=Haloferax massiliensis TaxID=1476858 RepID=A0A0D6JXP2_9EURY|nr:MULTISPECIES: MATE family efflux transporter [Haloferax]MDS0240752.1 MATE family efflux transporter [Haloferax sp. S2CR25]MDS0443873.1 MATE family efflux transporter [Haloferax sp. S2CR25-2]CQR53846.1 Multidrug export protein MepA [Haloferax massiliensis]